MRHNKKFNHLGRTASHRSAMLANMAISLIEHKRITTTVAKAKELKKYVEPLITKAKDDSTNSRRVVFSYLQNKEAIKKLFGEVAQAVGDRPGGYTRIIKLGTRQGDAAQVCFIELVDFDPERRHVVAVVVALLPRLRLLLLKHQLLRRQRQRLLLRRPLLLLKRQRLNKYNTYLINSNPRSRNENGDFSLLRLQVCIFMDHILDARTILQRIEVMMTYYYRAGIAPVQVLK